MTSKPSNKPKLTFDRTFSLYQNPLTAQTQNWLREIELKAKTNKTGKVHMKVDLYES